MVEDNIPEDIWESWQQHWNTPEYKKRRVYGLGSQASAFYPETFSSSSTTSRYDFTSDECFTQRVNEVVGQRVRVEV